MISSHALFRIMTTPLSILDLNEDCSTGPVGIARFEQVDQRIRILKYDYRGFPLKQFFARETSLFFFIVRCKTLFRQCLCNYL